MTALFEPGYLDTALRLLLAVLAGSLIGLNRFLRHKSAGMRTHGLVALGAAMATLMAAHIGDAAAVSRVAQGLVTGVGFIGAGVIMRDGESHIQGLTTAASIWGCAILGIVCGVADLTIAAFGIVLAMAILLLGRPLERFVARLANDEVAAEDRRD
jgi:putative Mg2+ transporter-C (MgtC) family protein